MADVDEFSTFQADTLPTGSISFGRFELETLSWERRSSFCHNRYLEEAEKYSTPGSVTQKKAYFEAHFKKKALERQNSSLNHDGIDCQITENDIRDHGNYLEEYVERGNDGQQTIASNCFQSSDFPNEQKHDEMESTGEHHHFSWYGDTPPAISDEDYDVIESSDGQLQFVPYDEALTVLDNHQHVVIDFQQEADNYLLQVPSECLPCGNMKTRNHLTEGLDHNDIIDKVPTYATTQSDIEDPIVVVEKEDDLRSIVSDLLEECIDSSGISVIEKDNAACSRNSEQNNVKSTLEAKPSKTNLKKAIPVLHTTRKASNTRKTLSSTSRPFERKSERENSLSTKTEKQAPLNLAPSTCLDSKNVKSKICDTMKSQTRQMTKSAKGPDVKKEGVNSRSISGNKELTNRNHVNSTKAEVRLHSVRFSFRSDERAEQRKEFYMRLEKKQHAKELEMYENQAKTQMKTEAEMKQLRRSLNFKAAPMPSFYHESLSRDSKDKKKGVTGEKAPKLQSMSIESDGRATSEATSESFSKATKNGCSSNNKPMSSTFASRNPDKLSVINRIGKREEERVKTAASQAKEGRVKVVRRTVVGKTMKGNVSRSRIGDAAS